MSMIETDGVVRRVSASYASRVSPYPRDESLGKIYAVDRYLAAGWMPEKAFIKKQSKIVAFGSCFAANISKYLDKRGYTIPTLEASEAPVTKMGDGMVHTHSIRQQFEWAWENKMPKESLWRDYDEKEFGYTSEARLATKKLFDEADVFVITLGLSEIWYDEPTGEVFWRAPPKGKFDAARHKFRVATFAETVDNIRAIHELINKYRPQAHVVITVSPIPLAATFRCVSAISANAASKAIIRAAIDEYIRGAHDPKLHYFPSYDIVIYAFKNQWHEDRRHVYPHILFFNMQVFEHYFCIGGPTKEELQSSYRKAMMKDRRIGILGHTSTISKPTEGRRAIVPSDFRAVQGIVRWGQRELIKIRAREAKRRQALEKRRQALERIRAARADGRKRPTAVAAE